MPIADVLCSHTVQVPPPSNHKRHYRSKQHDLSKISAQTVDMARDIIVDWIEGKKYTVEDPTLATKFCKTITALETCAKSLVYLETGKGEIKLARIHCNNEFCPICGRNDSALHKKRSGRATDRLLWSPVLGYMVFTVPHHVSKSHPSKELLKKLSKKAWEISKNIFDAPGGVVRTHFMGEELGKLHIHFNVLFPLLTERGAVPQEKLDELRQEWTSFLNETLNLSLTTTSVFYKFAVEPGKKIHKVKYVFRPVVSPDKFISLSDTDRLYICSFKNWHNTRWFGKLANSQYKKFFEENGLSLPPDFEHVAPISGEKYHFIGIVSSEDVQGGSFCDHEGHFHQICPLDKDVYVDLETASFLRNFKK